MLFEIPRTHQPPRRQFGVLREKKRFVSHPLLPHMSKGFEAINIQTSKQLRGRLYM